MILITHIIIAIISFIIAAILLARPTRGLVETEVGLIAGTLVSGVALLFQGASLLHLCISGLLFTSLSVVAVLIAVRRMKLAEVA
ncbi:MAG: hypothetical protein WBO49_01260 [Candidatus Saccharimonas sp.]